MALGFGQAMQIATGGPLPQDHHCGAGWGDYLPQRLLTAMVTTTDIPLPQSLVAGIALSVAARCQPGGARCEPTADRLAS